MILDPYKLLFCLNSDFSVDKCYGFVKKNVFDLFSNKTDWTFSIKCKIGECSQNYITLLSLEGIDFGLDFSKDYNLILRCKDGAELDSRASVVSAQVLRDRIYEFNTYTITFDVNKRSYQLSFNGHVLLERNLTENSIFESNKIKLCCIARQYFAGGNLKQQNGIEISNLMFCDKVMTSQELLEYFDSNMTFCNKDEYDRNVLKVEYQEGISAYYNFEDNMYGKIWDMTGNNNFFFTSLSLFERVGNSVL